MNVVDPSIHSDEETISRWFPMLQANQKKTRLTLICFPHAGGDVINYWPWEQTLSPNIELRGVSLPGKYGRSREKALPNFSLAVDALERTVRPLLHRPYALFGHSMGALLAFELARRLQGLGLPPVRLFVSGMKAPQLYNVDPVNSALDDAGLIELLRDLNGTPEEMLLVPEMMRLILPALRQDLALCDSYEYVRASPLECPVSVFAGRHDDANPDAIDAWHNVAANPCKIRWFDGGHMFLNEFRAPVLRFLLDDLRDHLT